MPHRFYGSKYFFQVHDLLQIIADTPIINAFALTEKVVSSILK